MGKMEKTDVPGVYRRGGRFAFSYRVRGRQKWGSAATKAEARRLKAEMETDAARGEHRDRSQVRFGEYADTWIENYQGRTARGFRESTRNSYRAALPRLKQYFDVHRGLRFAEIQPQDVKGLVRWLQDQPCRGNAKPGTKPRTLGKARVREHIAVARALFADAVEEGVLRYNPAVNVRISMPESEAVLLAELAGNGETEGHAKALTMAQLGRFLAAVEPTWQTFFEFLFETGLRIGEARELRWDDVKFGNAPTITVRRQCVGSTISRPKSKYGVRDIPLSPHMARELWRTKGTASGNELVFRTAHGTRVHNSNVFRRVLKPAARDAGVPWASFHTFRHTCASALFMSQEEGGGGKNLKQVQEWLGHHDPGFTLRTYIHLLGDGVGDANFFDSAIEAAKCAAQGATATVNTPGRNEPNVGDVAEAVPA